MRVVLNFKGLSEKDIEKFIKNFKWKSWSYHHLNEELGIEVEPKDFFPSEVLPRLGEIRLKEEEEEARVKEMER